MCYESGAEVHWGTWLSTLDASPDPITDTVAGEKFSIYCMGLPSTECTNPCLGVVPMKVDPHGRGCGGSRRYVKMYDR